MSSHYPKWRYHAKYEALLVKSSAHDESIGDGWADSPSVFGRDVENAPGAERFMPQPVQPQLIPPAGKEAKARAHRGVKA